MPRIDPSERFWSRVDKTAGPADCWPWIGFRDKYGYGQVSYQAKMVSTHRLAWLLSHGDIPTEAVVMHTCDNPPCCNPAHLQIGSVQDNRDDCVSKKRQARGEDQGHAKLTWAAVAEMRRLHSTGIKIKDLATQFGVHKSVAQKVIRNITWKTVSAGTQS